jgi:lysozyme
MIAKPAPATVRLWITRAIVLLLLAGAVLAAHTWWARGWRPDAARWPSQGAAIGPVNAPVSWAALARHGASFAYIDATSGARWANPRFAAEVDGARAAGLRTGAIHRYDLCSLSHDQASAFVRLVPRAADALPPVVMLDSDGDCARHPTRALLLSELSTFVNQIETHIGKPIIIAPDAGFEGRYGVASAINRPLWLRSDRSEPDPEGPRWVIWQANDALRLEGTTGPLRWLVVDSSEGQRVNR